MVMAGDAGLRQGWIISCIAHFAFALFVLFGGLFFPRELREVTVAEVSIISEAEYAALTPPAIAPETQSDAPEVSAPEVEDVAPETPDEDSIPDISEPDSVEIPETPAAPEIEVPSLVPQAAVVDDAPEIDMPEVDVDGTSLERNAIAAPAPRVAPTPSIAPPPDAEIAPEVVEDTAPDPDALPEDAVEDQTATAPEEASDRIVTEAEEVVETAPASSKRPRSRPPRPVRQAETSEVAPQPTDETADAVAAAVAEANEDSQSEARPAPSGPPLTGSEKDAFRVAVGGCWVVDPGARSAGVKVTVAFSLGRDGKPQGDIRQISVDGGDARTQSAAFQSARRAILRCGSRGFPLPAEKYDQWRDIEMTFNPEGMQVR